jgi:hypothetical protein
VPSIVWCAANRDPKELVGVLSYFIPEVNDGMSQKLVFHYHLTWSEKKTGLLEE